MARWLIKSEPDYYSYYQLELDQSTVWDGVTNALALKHIRAMQTGDEVFYYHTGDVKAIVGIAQVSSDPRRDPDNEKSTILDIVPVRRLDNPVTLVSIKTVDEFADWELVRQSRLSVMPVPDKVWERIIELSRSATGQPLKPMGKRK